MTLPLRSLPLLVVLGLATLSSAALAQGAKPIKSSFNLGKQSLAIEGYDPVAYFPEGGGKPRKGDSKLSANYRGAVYRFASEKNRKAFLAHPSRFEPAYGGYCAYAMASDDRVEVDVESFLIQDGQLMLFFDGFFADTRKKWLKEGPEKLEVQADRYWLDFAKEPRQRPLALYDTEDGLALGGHDPLSFFAEAPQAGRAELTVNHRGLSYRFASEQNRDAFLAQPSRYEPAFGGWSASAMARGERVASDPAHYRIDQGRLTLFASAAEAEAWNDNARSQAGRQWQGMLAAARSRG